MSFKRFFRQIIRKNIQTNDLVAIYPYSIYFGLFLVVVSVVLIFLTFAMDSFAPYMTVLVVLIVYCCGVVSLFYLFAKFWRARPLMVVSEQGISLPFKMGGVIPWHAISRMTHSGAWMTIYFSELQEFQSHDSAVEHALSSMAVYEGRTLILPLSPVEKMSHEKNAKFVSRLIFYGLYLHKGFDVFSGKGEINIRLKQFHPLRNHHAR